MRISDGSGKGRKGNVPARASGTASFSVKAIRITHEQGAMRNRFGPRDEDEAYSRKGSRGIMDTLISTDEQADYEERRAREQRHDPSVSPKGELEWAGLKVREWNIFFFSP